jgi:hypothetical protein
VAKAVILNQPVGSVKKISDLRRGVRLESILPFRVRFTTVGVSGFGPGNPAPIGIAIVGINNYIL